MNLTSFASWGRSLSALAFLLAACSAEQSPSPKPLPGVDTLADALTYQGSCTPEACKYLAQTDQAGSKSCKPNAAGVCEWHLDDGDRAVSFRQCEANECGPLNEIGCPDGLRLTGTVCGAEDEGACLWRRVCVPPPPPPGTEPCAEDQCGPMTEEAHFCDDGSLAKKACMEGQKGCRWEVQCP
jgi:hypothetical protein